MTNQPNWAHIGSIGDTNPVAFGGALNFLKAIVYIDTTGKYSPEMTWFESGLYEEVEVSRVLIEECPIHEWWYDKLAEVAGYSGITAHQLQEWSHGSVMDRAFLYRELIYYHGVSNFDECPDVMTTRDAYVKFHDEIARWQREARA